MLRPRLEMLHPSLPPLENPLASGDPDEARARREDLIASLAAAGDIKTRRVADAMRAVPRHLFVPGASLARAYENRTLAIGHGQTISQPAAVAKMTEALELDGHERVLEVGTGCGYHAAILSILAAEVRSVERVRALGDGAAARLARLGYGNVYVKVGDGYVGWRDAAPFDRIFLTAAPPGLPRALVGQLVDGGIIVAPIGQPESWQSLVRYRKLPSGLAVEDLGSLRFVPPPPEA